MESKSIINANFTAAPDTALYLHSIYWHYIFDVLSFIKTGDTEKALQMYLYHVPLNDD